VNQETAAERAAFRDTPASDATGLRQTAYSGTVRARVYVIAMFVAGCFVLTQSVLTLRAIQPPLQWWALVALTVISGSAVLKIPSISVNFSISDVFTLTAAVVFGPAAGTAVVAIDTLVISVRLKRTTGLTLEKFLFNAAAPPVAMWISAVVFFRASGIEPLYVHPLGVDVVGPWLLVFAGLYFVLNTFPIAVVVALHERANVLSIWRKHFQNLWFTFIGGALGAAFVVFALQLGTYGLVILALPLLLAVILHFAYRNATGRVADQLRHLAEMSRLHLSTIEALARAVDAKDGVTHDHIRRVQNAALVLARRLGVDGLQLRAIEAAALLHDVGKLAIPEHILNKPGRLTPAEFERMKSHARIGAEILSEVDFPYPLVPIVRHHHENWDGTGYPDGLKGDEIPIGARILAVVDCFDALTSNRPYRRALSMSDAFAIIDARSGTMYDPTIVEAFHRMCEAGAVTEVEPCAEQVEVVRDVVRSSTPSSASTAGDGTDDVRIALDLGASLARGLGRRPSWPLLADVLCELPGVDTVAVFVVDDTEEWMIAHHVSGAHATHIAQLSIRVGERMSGWVAASGQPMINADAALDLFDLFDASATPLASALAMPCDGPDGHRAVVALYSTEPGAFRSLHERLVEAAVARLSGQETAGQIVDIRQDKRHRRPRSLMSA